MKNDPIVNEVRKAREAIFAECGYDLDRLVKHLQKRQEEPSGSVTKPRRKKGRAA